MNIKNLYTNFCVNVKLSFLLGIYRGGELLGQMVTLWLLEELPD